VAEAATEKTRFCYSLFKCS